MCRVQAELLAFHRTTIQHVTDDRVSQTPKVRWRRGVNTELMGSTCDGIKANAGAINLAREHLKVCDGVTSVDMIHNL